MSSTFNNLVIYNGYPISIVAAVSFHIMILAALLYLQANTSFDRLELIQPTVITALFIDENPQQRNERIIERQRLERVEEQRLAREREQRRLQDEEVQRQAEAERLLQEQERERAALVEREELDRRQAERETEAQRQQDLAETERQRQALQQERIRQQTAQVAAADAARTELQLIQSATGLIQQLVQENWSRPPSARNGMRAIIQIRMLPTGELLNATITLSSGDPAFDRSAENAVYRAAPFTELQSLPINIFTANFRTLSLIFEPEDLLN